MMPHGFNQFHQNFTISSKTKQSPFHRRNIVIFGNIFRPWKSTRKHFMAIDEPIPLDLKTVSTLKEVLDDAWYGLSAEQQAMVSKTVPAERILRSAARGERDRERLLAAALVIAA
jgi:hypothetical protein